MSDKDASVEALRHAAEARAEHRRLAAQLGEAQALAATRDDDVRALEVRLQAEEADVRRIEGLSPSRLWATLRGDVDDRAARERAERDAAAQAVASARGRRDQAQREVARLLEQRSALEAGGPPEERYATALTDLERALREEPGTLASDLRIIAADLGQGMAELREIDEAIAALDVTTEALERAFATLRRAGGWSTYDTFFGGGVIADLVKHSRIDESSRAFADVNRALEHLRIELADIGVGPVRGVEVSDSLAVFDVLFDNVFSDLMVRERIARAREEAVELRVRLSELGLALAERKQAGAEHVASLARRREQLLLGVG